MKATLLLIIVLTGLGFAQDVKAKNNRTNPQILNFILDFQREADHRSC